MAIKRSPRRNEIKVRVTDELHTVLEAIQERYRFSSMNDAANFLMEHSAFGLLGSLQQQALGISPALSHSVAA